MGYSTARGRVKALAPGKIYDYVSVKLLCFTVGFGDRSIALRHGAVTREEKLRKGFKK